MTKLAIIRIPEPALGKQAMNVSLTPKLEALIKRRLDSGLYSSASEIVREALRLLEEREARQSTALRALRKDVAVGLRQLDAGRGTPLDVRAIKARGRRALARREPPTR